MRAFGGRMLPADPSATAWLWRCEFDKIIERSAPEAASAPAPRPAPEPHYGNHDPRYGYRPKRRKSFLSEFD